MEYPAYDKYRKTDVEWLCGIPSEWNVIRSKYIFKFLSGDGFPHEFQGKNQGEYPFLKVSDISFLGKNVNTAINYVDQSDVKKMKWTVIPKESILMPKIGEALKLNHRKILRTDALIDNNTLALCSLSGNACTEFLYYVSLILDMRWIVNPGAVPSINMEQMRNLDLPIPSIGEQQKIASFLNFKTQQIDQLIEKKKALIEKLNEQRIAVITQAVTKGLDKNAKMKPSGVDWLGDVPEHWELKRFKFAVNLRNVKFDAKETELPYMGMENIESFTAKKIYDDENPNQSDGMGSFFKKGDVLFGKLRPYLAKGYLSDSEGFCSSELLVLESIGFEPEYLVNLVLSDWFIKLVNSSTYGAKMPRANWEYISNLICLIPERQEQKDIVSFISLQTKNIEKMNEASVRAIERLEEYRSAIITSAVTGKIDVRNIEIGKDV